jgi:APA family basic amino acid/polyamine antiporter
VNWKPYFKTKSIESITRELHTREQGQERLNKTLGVWDLTALGVAAILGAGIFSTIGNAAADGGPAVIFLFLLTAIACAFSALCYAEFASVIPASGSAYTYAYASFGEIIAWIIGWDLLMEYAIGNIAVSISWSQYFTGLLAGYGLHLPKYLTLDFMSASTGYNHVNALLAQGQSLAQLVTAGISTPLLKGYDAWIEAPRLLGLPLICDLPTLLITVVITGIVYVGIEESRKASNFLVLIKLAVVALVIGVGATYVKPENWIPFAPNGAKGVLKGVSAVFFAYIGFDAVSTTAEECKNPQRDLPLGMIYALVICTLLYAVMTLVLTGMVSSSKLGVGDPLAYVFGPEALNLPWIAGIVNVGALIALSTVLLVFQVGQPRVSMAMSRDGLLPPIFSAIHPKYRTPWFSTLVMGFMVGIPALFMNLNEVTDLTSIGTLFAFLLVCGGSLIMKRDRTQPKSGFTITYVNSKYIFPVLMLVILGLSIYFDAEIVTHFFSLTDPAHPNFSTWGVVLEKIPFGVFLISMVFLSYFSFTRNLSLIPVLGLASCGYLMTELGITNWTRFGIWLAIGALVYRLYGFKNSRLYRAVAT